jgi:hypothetical protein
MEIIIGLIVIFILYKVIFSFGVKSKNRDAIIGASVRLGVPELDVINIIETKMDKLGPMLHMTTMKGSIVADKPAYESMAYCISAVHKKQKCMLRLINPIPVYKILLIRGELCY